MEKSREKRVATVSIMFEKAMQLNFVCSVQATESFTIKTTSDKPVSKEEYEANVEFAKSICPDVQFRSIPMVVGACRK